MARLNIAMLGEQAQEQQQVVIDENNEALVTDQDAAQIQQQGAQIEEVQAVVQETQDAADSLQQTADKIEQMPEVSQEVVQIAQEQIAYFMKRTGMKMPGVTSAMESYSTGKAGNKEALVKQMNLAVENLNKSVAIAQEGIIDRIKNRFSLVFSSAKKLNKELVEVSDKYDSNGAKQEVIKDPAFARVLNPKSEALVKTETVIGLINDIMRISNDQKIIKSIVDITIILEKVTLALTKSTFVAKDAQLEKMEDFEIQIFKAYDEIKQFINIDNKKSSADIEPLQPTDKEKIKKFVVELLDIRDFEKVESELGDAVDGLYGVIWGESQNRLLGSLAADMRAAERISNISEKLYDVIDKIMSLRYAVAHACVKYIKASTAG